MRAVVHTDAFLKPIDLMAAALIVSGCDLESEAQCLVALHATGAFTHDELLDDIDRARTRALQQVDGAVDRDDLRCRLAKIADRLVENERR
jgi:hypothetical protein